MIITLKDAISKENLAFIDQAFVSGMNFITGLALTRFLGLEGYGQYVLVYGVVLFFSTLQMSLVVSPMMAKGPVVEESIKRRYFSAMTIQQLLFCFGSAVIIIAGGLVAEKMLKVHQFERLLVPLALATAAFLAQDYYRRYFFVVKRPVSAIINDVFSYGTQFALILVFGIMKNIDTKRALWFMAFVFFLAAFMALVQSGKNISLALCERSYFAKVFHESYHFGKWLLGVNMMYWGQAQIVNYFVAGALSVTVVGAMNACKNILGILNVFFLGLQNILLPDTARSLKNDGIEGLRKYLTKVTVFGGIITFAIVLIASVWSEYWIELLYGSAYRGYGWIVVWWGAYFVVGFFHRPYSAGLSALNKTKTIFRSMVIGFVLFIVLGYFFTMFWQVNGIMFLMCFSNVLTLIILVTYFKRGANTLPG
jgi:O-antigen/teichoic acid export membrane protein